MNEEDEFLVLLRQQRDAILTQAAVQHMAAETAEAARSGSYEYGSPQLSDSVKAVVRAFQWVQEAMAKGS